MSHLGTLRRAAGYTQAQAAAKLPGRGQPLHVLSLSNIECGRGGASKVLLKAMAALYRYPLKEVAEAHGRDVSRFHQAARRRRRASAA